MTSLGNLVVTLGAETASFVSGVGKALEASEKLLKGVKKLANEVAGFSAVLTGMGGAAVALAAGVDDKAAASMDELKKSTELVAVQISDVLTPVVKEISGWFQTIASYVAGLSTEQRESIQHWATLAVQIGVAAKGIALAVSLFEQMAETGAGVVKMLGGLSLGAVVSIGLVVGAIVLLHRAWRQNWGDIQGFTDKVINGLSETFGGFFDWLGGLFGKIVDAWSWVMNKILDGVDALQKLSGVQLVDVDGLREGFAGLAKDLKTGEFFRAGAKALTDAVSAVGSGFVEEIGIMADEVKSLLGLGGLKKGKARQPHKTEVTFGEDTKTHAGELASGATGQSSGWLADIQKSERDMRTKVLEENEAAWKVFQKSERDAEYKRRDEIETTAKAQQAKTKAMLSAIGNIFQSGMGEVGRVIGNIKSAATSGGVWGALIAALMEMVQSTAGFADFMQMASYGLKRLGEMVSVFSDGLFKQAGDIGAALTEKLAPLFEIIGQALGPITNALTSAMPVVSAFFDVLMTVFDMFASLGDVLDPMAPVLEVVFGALVFVLKIFGIALLGLKVAFQEVLGFVNGIAAWFLDLIGDTSGANKARAAADKARADSVDDQARLAAMTQEISDQVQASNGNMGEFLKSIRSAQAGRDGEAATKWREASKAQDKATASLKNFGEMLTNVPTGFKVALARMDATAPGDALGSGGLDFGGAMKSGRGQAGDVFRVDTVIIQTSGDGEETLAAFERAARKKNGQQHGNPEARRPGQSPK